MATPVAEPAGASILTAKDRCDRCGAQAYVGLVKGKGELLFCAHHAGKHAAALVDDLWEIVADSRHTLRGPR